MAGPRGWLMAWVASQLGRPHGWASGPLAAMLNRSNRRFIARAVEALGLRPGATAADLGFGGGVGLELLLESVGPTGSVYGVDVSPDIVRRAALRYGPKVVIREGSLTSLPLDDASVDGAITVNTLYFIADLDRAFAEVARTLKPAGKLAVGVGDPLVMASMPMTPYGFRLRAVDDVVAAAVAGGLRLEAHERTSEGERAHHVLVFGRRP